MTLTTEERRKYILEQIYEHGKVLVKTLASQMNVSEATIRRDLRALADEHQVELVYGGANLPRNSDYSFLSKQTRNIREKQIVGRTAGNLVNDNDLIFIDSGTTCFQMIPSLKTKKGLSVIVNSLRIATELGESPNINIITLGGQYRNDRMDCVGPLAITTIEHLRGYTAFIGADGLSMEFGITAADIDSAHLYGLVIKNARETILVVDHTKFLTPSLFKISDWDAISRIVVDTRPPSEWCEFLDSKGIEIIYPKNEITEIKEYNHA